MSIFRRHVEKEAQETARKQHDLEFARLKAFVDLVLEAEKIEDPQLREAALSSLPPLLQEPPHNDPSP